jgi:hypothetical protein
LTTFAADTILGIDLCRRLEFSAIVVCLHCRHHDQLLPTTPSSTSATTNAVIDIRQLCESFTSIDEVFDRCHHHHRPLLPPSSTSAVTIIDRRCRHHQPPPLLSLTSAINLAAASHHH